MFAGQEMEEDACDCAGDTSKSQGRGQCEDPCRGAGKDDVPNTKMDFEKESQLFDSAHDEGQQEPH